MRKGLTGKTEWQPVHLFKPGTKGYYRNALELIAVMALSYDGHDMKNAKSMKHLVDCLNDIAETALKHGPLYFK